MKLWLSQLLSRKPQIITSMQSLSWEQIEDRSKRKASIFQASGLKKGDIVAVSGSKLWLLESWIACIDLELIFCPVPKNYRGDLNEPQLSVSKGSSSRQVVWHSESGPDLISQRPFDAWSFLDQMQNPCALLKTSGSMGAERWVAYEADRVQRQIFSHSEELRTHSGLHRLQLLPLYHTFGLILDLCVGLQMGQSIHFVEMEQIVSTSWMRLAQTRCWDMALTPRLVHLLTQYPRKLQLGLLHVGGARWSEKLASLSQSIFQHVVEGYGLTECGPGVLLNGKPIDCEVALEPLDGALSPSLGVLKVKSPTMGVWPSSPLNRDNPWYYTRDLAIEEGGRWSVIGRMDRCIKRSDGQWVWLDELESVWEAHLGLNALHMGFSKSSELMLTLLEEDSHMASALEKLVQRQFDLPMQFMTVAAHQLRHRPSKGILAS